MNIKGIMRTLPVLFCLFNSPSVFGLSKVKGSVTDGTSIRNLESHNPFLNNQKHAEKGSTKPELGPTHVDPKMLELHPEGGDYNEDYVKSVERAEDDGDFEGMPPDMYMEDHDQINAEADAENKKAKSFQEKGSKGGGAYEADYEYYPGPGKGSKISKSYDDYYYYDDYCYEEGDDEEEHEGEYDSGEYVYYDEHGMSYPSKGKGKGGSKGHSKGYNDHNSTDTGKGKGKGGAYSKSSKKSAKGKGGKNSKGSKSSKSGCISGAPHSSPPPATSKSSKSAVSRPPTPVMPPTEQPPSPGPPTMMPPTSTMAPVSRPPSPFTTSPTDADSEKRELTPYAIAYTVPQGVTARQATRAEQDELENLTRLYLEEFFEAEYANTMLTSLDDFLTELTSHAFMMGEPLICNYMSIARFDPDSVVFPSTPQLDTVLEIAFTGTSLVEYESRLAELPDGNIFKDTKAMLVATTTRVAGGGTSTSSTTESNKSHATTIAATAVAAALVAASVIIYKKRSNRDEEIMANKDLNDKPGDNTVAGDTFDGTASISAASLEYLNRQQRYDEESGKTSNLRTIAEGDDSSLRPVFGEGGQMNDSDSDSEDDEDGEEGQDEDNDGDEHDETGNASLRRGFGGSSLGADSGLSFRPAPSDEDATSTDLDFSRAPSFEEVALQGPSYEPYKMRGEHPWRSDKGSDEQSHTTESEAPSIIPRPQNRIDGPEIQEVQSLLTFDSEEDMAPPSSLVERPPKKTSEQEDSGGARRPRTVAEIEALLSAGIDDDDDEDKSIMTHLSNLENKSQGSDSAGPDSARPRTIEEIESLLSGEL